MLYQKKRTSANMITIKLCHLLLEANIEFDVEYTVKRSKVNPVTGKTRYVSARRQCRFDLVIIKDNQIILIVETKPGIGYKATNQLNKYAQFGVPVLACRGEEEILATFEAIQAALGSVY